MRLHGNPTAWYLFLATVRIIPIRSISCKINSANTDKEEKVPDSFHEIYRGPPTMEGKPFSHKIYNCMPITETTCSSRTPSVTNMTVQRMSSPFNTLSVQSEGVVVHAYAEPQAIRCRKPCCMLGRRHRASGVTLYSGRQRLLSWSMIGDVAPVLRCSAASSRLWSKYGGLCSN